MDTIKARLQAEAAQSASSRSTLSLKSLYRGVGAALIGGVPATCIYLTSYEMSKGWLPSYPFFQQSPFCVYFASGMIAEALSCIVFVPTDVIKERLQVQGKTLSYGYRGSWDALQQIVRQEGLRGLFKGYGASLLSFGPFSALYFAIYEAMKKRQGASFADNLFR